MNQRCQIPPAVGCGACQPAASYVARSPLGACPVPQMGCATCGGKPLAGGCGVGQVDAIVFGGGSGRGGGGRPGPQPITRPFPFPIVRPIIQYPYYQQPVYVQPAAPAGCVGPVQACPPGYGWARNAAGYLCCVPRVLGRDVVVIREPTIIYGSPGKGRCTTSAGCDPGYYCVSGRCALDVTSQVT